MRVVEHEADVVLHHPEPFTATVGGRIDQAKHADLLLRRGLVERLPVVFGRGFPARFGQAHRVGLGATVGQCLGRRRLVRGQGVGAWGVSLMDFRFQRVGIDALLAEPGRYLVPSGCQSEEQMLGGQHEGLMRLVQSGEDRIQRCFQLGGKRGNRHALVGCHGGVSVLLVATWLAARHPSEHRPAVQDRLGIDPVLPQGDGSPTLRFGQESQ